MWRKNPITRCVAPLDIGLFAVLAVFVLCLSGTSPARAMAVDLELVLAVDVSGSIEADEAELQRRGFVEAFRNEAVIRAIQGGQHGRIAVTYVEWAGDQHWRLGIGWRLIDGAQAAHAFADELRRLSFVSALWTSISGAIDFAMERLDASPYRASRQVIDISGDGANNHGEFVNFARDRAVKRGVTINGLPIVNGRPSPFGTPQLPNLDWYFEDCVIGGPNAFIVVADGFQDFARAIKRKLIREIADLPGPRREVPSAFASAGLRYPVNLPQRPPCDAGEKLFQGIIDDI